MKIAQDFSVLSMLPGFFIIKFSKYSLDSIVLIRSYCFCFVLDVVALFSFCVGQCGIVCKRTWTS